MTNIEARPRWKWDIFWWIVVAAFLSLGMAGCGAAHPEPTGDGNVEDVQTAEPDSQPSADNPESKLVEEATGDTATTEGQPGNPGNSGTVDAGTAATPENAKTTLNAELDAFYAGDPDEIDAPAIEQLDDQDLLTPAVIAAWTSGMNFRVGEATSTGTNTATVDATITCRPIGQAYNQGSMNADELAAAVSGVEPVTSDIQVEMQMEPDGDWEPTAAGYEALSSALVGTLAR